MSTDHRTATPPPPKLLTEFSQLAGSPVGQTLAIFFGIWAGVLVEDHAKDIVKAVDLRRGLDLFRGDVLWWAAAFYALVILTILLTVAAQWAQNRVREADEARRIEAERRLTTQSDLLVGQTSALAVQTDQLKESSDRLIEHTTRLGGQSDQLLARSGDLLERSDQLVGQTHALREQTDVLRDLIQTLPPKTILTTYVKMVRTCRHTHVDAYDVEPDAPHAADQLRAAVRTVLGAITDLFQVYENAPPDSVIAANIMLFSPAAALRGIPVEEQRHLEQALTFAAPGTTLAALEGVLFLIEELSTRTDLANDAPDTALMPMQLPIPIERKVGEGTDRELWRVLPGAPLAWVRGKAVAYSSQETLLQWCTENGAYHVDVLRELRDYLGTDGSAVQSFVSLPLIRSIDEDLAENGGEQPEGRPAARNPPIGVLNIHSNFPGLLEDRRPDENLYILLYPILDIVIDLLSLLTAAEEAEGPGGTEVDIPGELG